MTLSQQSVERAYMPEVATDERSGLSERGEINDTAVRSNVLEFRGKVLNARQIEGIETKYESELDLQNALDELGLTYGEGEAKDKDLRISRSTARNNRSIMTCDYAWNGPTREESSMVIARRSLEGADDNYIFTLTSAGERTVANIRRGMAPKDALSKASADEKPGD